MKRALAICLSVAMVVCLLCTNLTITAEGKTWVDFDPQCMTTYIVNEGQVSFGVWSAEDETGLTKDQLHVSNITMRPHTNGYAAIRRFDSNINGNLYLEATWSQPGVWISNGSAGSTIDFCIVNQDRELVWPTTGSFHTFTYGEKYTETIVAPVTAGGSLYLIATNPSEAAMSLSIQTIAYVASGVGDYSNQIHSSGYLCGQNMDKQGVAGTHDAGLWYYMYAPSVELSTADPGGVTDEGQDVYGVTYTATELEHSSAWAGWTYATDMTNANTRKVFTQGANAYIASGYSLITRYTASTSGYFNVGYLGLALSNSWSALSGKGASFCIANQDGEIVYPKYGGPADIRAGGLASESAVVPSREYFYNMEAGDYLDFIITPDASGVPFGYGIRMSGSSYFNDSRVDYKNGGTLFLYHASSGHEEQGDRNVTMYWSNDLTVNKLMTSEWTEFVQLEDAPTAAPATVEAQVNVPTNVPDWKVGTLISDMNGVDGTGFAVMMNTFGRPRFVSGNVDWTANVDLRTGEWERLTFTADTANSKLYLYMDGVLADQTDLAAEAALTVSGKAPVIGNDLSYGSTSAFQGAMRKLALSSSVRSADAVATEMAASEATHYWKLNGDNRDKVGDMDGTITKVNQDWYEDGEPADADVENGEYTIIQIGDMQITTDFYRGEYQQVTQWIADNAERLNVQAVINSGDLVNNATTGTYTQGYSAKVDQWTDAKEGMDILTAAGLPIVYATGNHEFPDSGTKVRDATFLNQYFKVEDYLVQGEKDSDGNITDENPMTMLYAYPSTTLINGDVANLTAKGDDTSTTGVNYVETIENAVYVKNINGTPHIFFCLEVQPRKTVIDEWAIPIIEALEASEDYANAPIIVITHHYLTNNGKIDSTNATFADTFKETISGTTHTYTVNERSSCYTPPEVYEKFVGNYKNITTVLCGHVADDLATRSDIGVKGNKIVSIMNDPSYQGNGGEGNITIMRYKADGTVQIEYYSTILEKYYKPHSQISYDTEVSDDLVLDLSSLKQMGYYTGGVWYISSSKTGAAYPYLQYRTMAASGDYAIVRSYEAGHSGTLAFTLAFTVTTEDAYVSVCKSDGTVLWPSSGTWAQPAGSSTHKISCDVEAGEKIHIIVRRVDTSISKRASDYTEVRSGTIKVDGTTVESFQMTQSSHVPTTQGENGWYTYYGTASKMTMIPRSHSVAWGVDGEGGTLTSAISGDGYGQTEHIVSHDGTARFIAKPAAGYRLMGYYVNGKYVASKRTLTLPAITEDLDVKAKFERIKVEGDANGDGVINILDMVNMNNGIADDAAFTDKTVCDLVDDIAAANGVDVIDAVDFKELRRRILE